MIQTLFLPSSLVVSQRPITGIQCSRQRILETLGTQTVRPQGYIRKQRPTSCSEGASDNATSCQVPGGASGGVQGLLRQADGDGNRK